MSMIGLYPLRRTWRYLERGDIYLKEAVKILTINYNSNGKPSEGARDFVFYKLPQLQHKNVDVQMQTFQDITPSPFIQCFLEDGKDIIVDVDGKSSEEIWAHIKKLLGKSQKALEEDLRSKVRLDNPANFGDRHARKCLCEVPGQIPCPGIKQLPKEMRGKYKNLHEESLNPAKGQVPEWFTPPS